MRELEHERSTEVFTRAIELTASDGRVVAILRDDLHEMNLVLTHSNGLVVEACGRMIRFPWTTCPGAEAGLSYLTGVALADMRKVLVGMPRASYCTHLGDLASLAAAQAARSGKRTYRVVVPLSLDPLTMVWRDDARIVTLDEEATFIARRAAHVALGMTMSWGAIRTASDLGLAPSCHSLQPGIAPFALATGPDGFSPLADTAVPSNEG